MAGDRMACLAPAEKAASTASVGPRQRPARGPGPARRDGPAIGLIEK